MDLNYLQNVLLPKREAEIKEGKNLCTKQPIYVVLDLQQNIVSGHSEYSSSTNYKGKPFEFGYVDNYLDAEDKRFEESKDGMRRPSEITRFWTDTIVAFFLTSEAAHDYLMYQRHNLKNPYVYVFYSGYGNHEMDALLCNL
jgi:hypothetical protein